MLTATHLDLGNAGHRPGTLGVDPGLRGSGDDIRGPVREQHAPSGELLNRLAAREPRGQTRHCGDRGMPGSAHHGARTHRVADEHDGHRPELGAKVIEQLGQVGDRGGQHAVPAPEPEPDPAYQYSLATRGPAYRAGHGDHPEHGRVNRGGGSGAHLPAAVRDDDHAPN